MALDSTIEVLGHTNLKQIAENGSWSNAQKQNAMVAHTGRNDQFAELAYQNAIANQQLATQSALDHQNEVRAINKMFLGALSNKFINMDAEQAVSESQLFKGNANSDILSLISQVAAGQISGKVAMTTPPTSATDTGVASLLAMTNTLNQQNYSNNTTNSSLAALMTAMAGIMAKNVVNTPPEKA